MKFKSEDFCFDMEDHDAGLKYLAHVASHMANARLEQMLAEAPATLIEKTETLREAYDTAMKNWDMCATVSRQRQEEIANLNGALGTDRRRIDSLKEEVWRLQKSHDQIATDCKLVREENAALKAAVERWQEVVVAIEKMDGSKLNSQNYPLAVGSSWALLHMENQALRDKLDAKVNEAIDFCEKADDRKKENQSLRELLGNGTMISKSELKRLCTTNPLRAAELMHLLQHRLEVAKDALLVANEINHEPGCLATFASHDGCDCAKSTVRCALEEIG